MPSLRVVAAGMGLTSATRVNDMLRGRALPADDAQAQALLCALGAVGSEIDKGARLYRAARVEQDQEKQAAGLPGWWQRSAYIEMVRDIAPAQLLPGGQGSPDSGIRQDIHAARDALTARRDLTVHNYYTAGTSEQEQAAGGPVVVGMCRSSRRGSSRGRICWPSWMRPGRGCRWCPR